MRYSAMAIGVTLFAIGLLGVLIGGIIVLISFFVNKKSKIGLYTLIISAGLLLISFPFCSIR